MLTRLLARCAKGRPKLTFAILAADATSVTCRIGAILALSVLATAMRNDGVLNVGTYKVQLPNDLLTQGLIGAGVIAALLLISAIVGFFAVYGARKLARWMNERAIDDIMSGLATSPDIALKGGETDPNIFNRLLSQNAIHYGMMSETLVRMANPIVMFTLAWIVVFVQSPPLGIGIIVFVILFAPIFLKLFARTHNVAEDFYSNSATIMGQGISKEILTLNPQYGVYHGPHHEMRLKHNPYMADFLDALDNNILANERMGLLVGIIGALFVGFVVAVNSYLASNQTLDIGGLIALTGGFLYLVASARTVSSMLINLVRYYPQVKNVVDFSAPLLAAGPSEPALPLPETIVLRVNGEADYKSQHDTLRLTRGRSRFGLITPAPLSKFTLAGILQPLVAPGAPIETLSQNIVFVSARYRFKPNETISTNFNGGRPELSERASEIAMTMGVYEEFEALPNGFSTLMTDAVFNTLSGTARTALRLVPIMANPAPRLVVIEMSAIRNLNPRTFDPIFELLTDCFVVIKMDSKDCPANLAETFVVSDGEKILGIGDRDWLSQPEITIAKSASTGNGAALFI